MKDFNHRIAYVRHGRTFSIYRIGNLYIDYGFSFEATMLISLDRGYMKLDKKTLDAYDRL